MNTSNKPGSIQDTAVIHATIAEERTNPALALAVNRGIIYSKLMGHEDARRLMLNSGVPEEIINRTLHERTFRQI